MSDKQRYPYADAMAVAGSLVEHLRPACERIVIAGSLRRLRPDVGDIELLCIPRPADNAFYVDALDRAIREGGRLVVRTNTKGHATYGSKNKLLRDSASGIPVDAFSTDARNWGMALVVRTGPAEFNVRMMAQFKAIGFQGHAYGGVTNRNGEDIDCPDEEIVFKLLGWPLTKPEERR